MSWHKNAFPSCCHDTKNAFWIYPDISRRPVMGTWKSKNRHIIPYGYKYLLQYHIIFICRYRKKLLVNKSISDDIKQFSYEICQKHPVIIRYMKTDKEHIHDMIETEPRMSVSKIVNRMKSHNAAQLYKESRIERR